MPGCASSSRTRLQISSATSAAATASTPTANPAKLRDTAFRPARSRTPTTTGTARTPRPTASSHSACRRRRRRRAANAQRGRGSRTATIRRRSREPTVERRTTATQPHRAGREGASCSSPSREETADPRIDLRDVFGAACSSGLEEDQRRDSHRACERRPPGLPHPNGSEKAQSEGQKRRRRETSPVSRPARRARRRPLPDPRSRVRCAARDRRRKPRPAPRRTRPSRTGGRKPGVRARTREERFDGSSGDAEAHRVPVGRESAPVRTTPVTMSSSSRSPVSRFSANVPVSAIRPRSAKAATLARQPSHSPSSRQSTTSVPSSSTRESWSSRGTSSRSHIRRRCGSRCASASSVTHAASPFARAEHAPLEGAAWRRRRPGLARRCPSAAARRPD